MASRFLTESRWATDDRRAATWLMTVFSIAALLPSLSARADERPPASLIGRALELDSPGQPASERALAAAPFIPELRLRGIVEHSTLSSRSHLDAGFFAELAWPFGRRVVEDAVAAARDRRERSASRDALVEKITTAWHARRLAAEVADDVAEELAEEEADATIDALSGDALGARP